MMEIWKTQNDGDMKNTEWWRYGKHRLVEIWKHRHRKMKIWKTQKDGEWMDKYQNVADHYTGCSGPTWLIVIQ